MKSNSKDKKPVFFSCHICMKITDQIANCSTNRCKNSYCFQCIIQKFNQNFQPVNYIKNCWICYACGGSCKCLLCTGLGNDKRKRRGKNQNMQSSNNLVSPYGQIQSIVKDDTQKHKNSEDNDEQKQQNSHQQQRDRNKPKTRRLRRRTNPVFTYKTKRRSRKNKNKVQLKSLIQNLKPQDKIFKIKKQSIQSQSDESQSQSDQQDENNSQGQDKNQKNQSEIIDKSVSKYSSSLDYLENQNNISSLKMLKQGKDKPMKISQQANLQKMPTIKSLGSKKETSKSKEQIVIQNSLDIKPNQQLQDQQKQLNEQQLIKDQKPQNNQVPQNIQNPRKRKQKRQSKRRNKNINTQDEQKQPKDNQKGNKQTRRNQQIKMIQQNMTLIQNIKPQRTRRIRESHIYKQIQSNKFTQKSHQIATKVRLTRRMSKIQQKRSKWPDTKNNINQSREVPLQNNMKRRLRRAPRKNYTNVEKSSSIRSSKIQMQQSQNDQVIQENYENYENINNQVFNQGVEEFIQFQSRQNLSDQQQNSIENQQNNQNNTIKGRKSMLKQHLRDQLLKNKQYQIDDSLSSSESQQQDVDVVNTLQNNFQEEKKEKGIKQINKKQQEKLKVNVENDLLLKKQNKSLNYIKAGKSSQKIDQGGDKAQPISVVYKKGHHRKHPTQNIQNKTSVMNSKAHNNEAIKWHKISDEFILDMNNIKKLGCHALFARQNMSKQIKQLLRRRQVLIQQKIKTFNLQNNQFLSYPVKQ